MRKWVDLMHNNRKVLANTLNLNNTLMCGQCFNWNVKGDVYYGAVGQNALLLRHKDDAVQYCTLTESQDINTVLCAYFQMEVDLEAEIESFTAKNTDIFAELASKCSKRPGTRILQQDKFECTISFICSSNNNIARIRLICRKLSETYGKLLVKDSEYGEIYSFPDITELSKSTESQLKQLGLGYRAKFIPKTIAIIKEKGSKWLDSLEENENYREELTSLSGVGKKVADCIGLFSLKIHWIVPVDVHMFKFFNESIAPKGFKKVAVMTEKDYLYISDSLRAVFGDFGGWLHSIYYHERIDKRPSSKKKV